MPITSEDDYWVPKEDKFDDIILWDTGQVSKRDRRIISMKTKAEGASTHTPPPSNSHPPKKYYRKEVGGKVYRKDKLGMYRPKFYPDDPHDHWDTGLLPKDPFDDHRFDLDGFKHGDVKIGKRRFNLSTKIDQPSIGRRLRKMSTKFSIPVIPILLAIWIFTGNDDDEKVVETVDTTKTVEENKSFKEEVVGVMDKIEKDIIPAAKEKWEQAKEELKSDKPEPAKESGDDPYTQDQDDRYGSTDKY